MLLTVDKVKALIEAPAATSIAQVHSFLGMANSSAHFTQLYSETTAPLQRFELMNERQTAFETLKKAMASPAVMSYYDPTRPARLIADSFKYDLASILTRLDTETGDHKVVDTR
ncbi:Hypothetical predicted protein [Paramuricea clavata]|uniref:Reverse transcriptase/retrotransposon-derived protein RNase H-like domain-containing protein n=1 Tax=Paramuricea clavata TaxID=317549 RepID=A0A6S7HYJ8_PARCT|nr:Hypothetical predicted protein [Paramuricea clavata]